MVSRNDTRGASMRISILFNAALVLVAALAWANPAHAYSYGSDFVRCESFDGRSQYCRVDTRGGVALLNQLSRSGCFEGSTWGWDRGGVWVSSGCRAEFRLGGGRGGDNWRDDRRGRDARWQNDWRGQNDWRDDRWQGGRGHGERRVVCESRRDRYTECRIRGLRNVDIVRQFSSSRCSLGHSWGWQRGVIWVDRGCRAEFVVY